MIKQILVSLLVLSSSAALAQFTPGQVLTAAQLNSALAGKAFTGTSGTSQLQYLQGATGSVARSLTRKFQDGVSVLDFTGVDPTGTSDSSTGVQSAVNALPSAGGRVAWPDGVYIVSTPPNTGTKSVYWDFGPNVVITGNGGAFPAAQTNTGVIPVGPWIVSQSPVQATATNGTATFSVEAMQPATLNGGVSAYYGGVNLTNGGSNSIGLASNLVATAQNGSSGNIWGQEIDVGMFAPTGTGTQFGTSYNGIGTGNPTFGVKFQRADSSLWQQAIDIRNAQVGINIENTTGLNNAIVAGSIPTIYTGQTVMIGQLANSGSALILQRYTNTSPTGYLINAVNANNTGQLFSVDIGGNTFAGGNLSHAAQERDLSYTFNSPTTGATVTLATGTETAIIAPAGTLAALTVALPPCTAGNDGSLARYSSSQTITALTVSSASSTVSSAPSALSPGIGNEYICRGSATTWYRLY